jgi:hypothetical protein
MERDKAADILGVDEDASDETIDERYQDLVKKNHPDNGGSAGIFKQIQTAYETLSKEDASDGGTSASENRSHQRDEPSNSRDVSDLQETYDVNRVSEIAVEKLVDTAIGRIVTENRLLKQKPGFTHPQTLTDQPLIGYISKAEQPHFTLRFKQATKDGDTTSPENGGFLVITDARILVLFGYEDGDEQYMILYPHITAVDSLRPIVSTGSKFKITTRNAEMEFKIDHNPIGETQLSGQDELDQEIAAAEQFIREMVYQIMD